MAQKGTAEESVKGQKNGLQTSCRTGLTRPPALEELDGRLEAASLSISGMHADEPCVWACACFLIHGS